MRNLVIVLLAVLLSACGSYRPVSLSAAATGTQPMQCVNRELGQMGYTITNSTSSSVTGVQVNTQPWYKRIVGFDNTADQITATLSGGQLEITALSSDPTDASEGGRAETGLGATEQAERDVRQIIGACTT